MSKCNKCKYEYHPMIATPCVCCREQYGEGSLGYITFGDKFQPKEEQPTTEYNGCNDCYYEWLGESDAPCCECKHRFESGTMARLKAKDYFKPKEEKWHSSNCTISSKECNKTVTNGNYGFEKNSNNEIDMVNHPQHYAHGIEPIDYIESHNLNFNLGNVIKYVSCAPFKGTELQDLKKVKWYLEREIKRHDK